MGQTSIGSPDANMNENHPQDDNPSKTFGAERGERDTAKQAPSADGVDNLRFDGVDKPAGAAGAEAASAGVPVNPEAYPDGPNIGPSPQELEAARGNTSLKPQR